jgi:hypothetical protein
MPINTTMFLESLKVEMPNVSQYQRDKHQVIESARREFHSPTMPQDLLASRAERYTTRIDRMARCAIPQLEPMGDQFPSGAFPVNPILVASDGSQIYAERDRSVVFSLINIAFVIWPISPERDQNLAIDVVTELYLENRLYGDANQDNQPGQNEHLDMIRDVHERELLVKQAQQASVMGNVFAWTDGPLELYGARNPSLAGNFEISLGRCRDAMQSMADLHIPWAGYIASAKSTLLVRLLEIGMVAPEDLPQVRKTQPLGGVVDDDLLRGWLKPNNRTAVFRLGTRGQGAWSGKIQIHFFYLNVGKGDEDEIVRVEVPKWLAEDPELLGQLHSLFLDQCQIIPTVHYPYILTRVDEEARVSPAEREIIEQKILRRLAAEGIKKQTISGKYKAKTITRGWNR